MIGREPMRVFIVTVLLGFAACRCRDQGLNTLTAQLKVPAVVDCGPVRIGSNSTVAVSVENTGATAFEDVTWLAKEPFAAEGPARLEPGPHEFSLTCQPSVIGQVEGQLTVQTAGGGGVVVGLRVEGVPTPECHASAACHLSQWNEAAGRCVDLPVADGAGCELTDACLVDAHCISGRCVGQAKDCDDHDACTVDLCESTGCVHQPLSCQGDGVCQVGACDPAHGCIQVPGPDGVPCGPLRTCTAAQVCIGGSCQVRDPPDDFVCAEASPCQAEGRCSGTECVQPAATVLRPSWTVGAPQPDGGPPEAWSDLLATPSGALTTSSYFMSAPVVGINSAKPLTLVQAGRRCIHWAGGLVCGDYPGSVVAGVSLIDPTTGAIKWTYSTVSTQLPQFALPSVQVFLARLAVLDAHVLAVLFESRTLDANGVDPRCRRFGLVTLDEQGHPRSATLIEHRIFEVCTHPHSYGVAVDVSGNLYLAFSPSEVDNPASAIQGTTLFSYSPQLELRWQVDAPLVIGGELAVAKDHVFHERSSTVWSARTGATEGVLPVPFGFGVISRDVILPSPVEGATDVWAVDVRTLSGRWRQSLGFVAGGPVHVGSMATSFGSRDVALAFTGDAANRSLTAVDLGSGGVLFNCPIELPERPAQSALTPGQLAVMSGPRPVSLGFPECDLCDPRWARTRNTFSTYSIPGLSSVAAPWPGAWGGVDHDHREDPVP